MVRRTGIASLAVLWSLMGICVGGPSSFLPLGYPRDKHPDLPRPLGVRLSYYMQKQTYELDDLQIRSQDATVNAMLGMVLEQSGAPDIGNRLTQESVQADVWLLPYLNLFGIAGQITGETDVALPSPFQNLDIDYRGTVYGLGAVLAGAYRACFASLTGIYTDTSLDEEGSSTKAWVVQPRAGVCLTDTGARDGAVVWAGATYQSVEEAHKGAITLPGVGAVSYDVKLKDKTPWNYLVGASVTLASRWELTLEGGLGDRRNVEVVAGYRF